MGRIFDALQQYLTGENIRFETASTATALRFGFRTEAHSWMCIGEVREEPQFLIFLSRVTDEVAAERRAAVNELLMRINSGLAIGSFELDYDTDRVRFRTSIDLEGSEPTQPIIRQLVRANLSTMSRYIGAIQQVLGGGAPLDALQTVG